MSNTNKTFELWRPVVDFEGLYEVSNQGRVRSLNYRGTGEVHILVQNKTGEYLNVSLCNKEGFTKTFLIHRLVARAWIQPNIAGLEINHLNEDKTDNRVCNLSVCTHAENIRHGTAIIRGAVLRQKAVYQKNSDGVLVAEYSSLTKAARMNGIKIQSISACCRGKNKTAGGFYWQLTGKKHAPLPKLYESQFAELAEK